MTKGTNDQPGLLRGLLNNTSQCCTVVLQC